MNFFKRSALLVLVLPLFLAFPDSSHAARLNIGSAKYDARKAELKVSGGLTGAPSGTKYSIIDDVTDRLLGTVVGGEKFQFVTGNFNSANPPCSVRVEASGLSAAASVRSAPEECSVVRFQLAGVVRDAPIPYATVTITVGGNTFTTVADENGNFVIEIAGIDLSSLVLIESTGTNPADETRTVDMASIAGTLEKLVEDADADGIVDGTENPNINNTPYTTALFVLVGEANGGETPTTLEELQDAERSVDATELLQLAAVIKLIVDEGYELPIDPGTGEPYETIIAFLADAEVDGGGNTPVENFIADNSGAIETAVEEILTDNEIVPAFAVADIPDRYYWLWPAQVGFLSRSGQAFDFVRTPAQTGEIRAIDFSGSGEIVPGEYNWDVVNGRLVLDWTLRPSNTYVLADGLSNSPDLTLRCREPDHPQFASCQHSCADYQEAWAANGYQDFVVTQSLTQSELTKYAVSAGGTREFASQTDVQVTEIQDLQVNLGSGLEVFEFCDEIESVTNNVELLNAAVNPPRRLEVADFAGDTLAVAIIFDPDGPDADPINPFDPGSTFGESLFLDFVTLNGDTADAEGYRSTTTLLSGVDLDWRIVDDGAPPADTNADGGPDGNELQFRYASGVQQTLRQLEPAVGLETAFWVEVNGVAQPYGLYDITLRVDPDLQISEPDLINDPGEFWNAVVLNGWQKVLWQTNALGQFELIPGASFGWEFAAIPTANNLFTGDVLAAAWDILAAPLSAGLGTLQDLPAGTVHIYQPWNNRDRYWIPIAETSVSVPADVAYAPTPRTRLYVLEHRYRASNDFMDIPPRINAVEIFDKTVLD